MIALGHHLTVSVGNPLQVGAHSHTTVGDEISLLCPSESEAFNNARDLMSRCYLNATKSSS